MSSKRIVARSKQASIFGAGLVSLDLVVSADPATPVRAWAGGTCGNVLTILSYLGWDAFPIARLNGEPVSNRVREDLRSWGVHLDFVACEPSADAPIVVQEIRRGKNGLPSHRFRWACLNCGHWLPSYRSVTLSAVSHLFERVGAATVYFLDRVTPANLQLAQRAAEAGALVVFEPSAKAEQRLTDAAIAIAHVLKYSDQRFELRTSRRPSSTVLLEVKTLGGHGLKYRSWLSSAPTGGWAELAAIPAPRIADTCGSGDWCTAGIIHKLARSGVSGLMRTTAAQLESALRYGQALAAWNCGFEGARGGMYAVSRRVFERQVGQLATGEVQRSSSKRTSKSQPQSIIRCPACSVAS